MRIGPTPSMSSNLTIALIERDRSNPTAAAQRSLRNLQATRVAVSRQCQFAPEPLPSTTCGPSNQPHHPREYCEAAVSRSSDPVYEPHRIPMCASAYQAQQLPPRENVFDHLIDVYG
ncbi:MAG: hypothetical protein WD294_15895 [Phycisphaeraceae bacterium]